MNRINQLFNNKRDNILSIFFTAGYPELNSTTEIIKSLSEKSVDMLEIGIPYSDPLADGPVIQSSSEIALNNGMSLHKLFTQLENIREITHIPLILMGYYGVIYKFGIDKFCLKCKETGIDGVIIPDMPLDIFEKEHKTIFKNYDIKNINLITPQTSDERIKYIDSLSDSFIYMVSTSSTTGAKDNFSDEQVSYFERIKNMKLSNPKLIGFGISNNKTYTQANKYAEGTIIGSAFVKSLNISDDISRSIEKFMNSILTKN